MPSFEPEELEAVWYFPVVETLTDSQSAWTAVGAGA